MTRDETVRLFMECEAKRAEALAIGKSEGEAHEAAKAHWNAWANALLTERDTTEADGRSTGNRKDWSARAGADFSFCLFLNKGMANEEEKADARAALEIKAADAGRDVKAIHVESAATLFDGFRFPANISFHSSTFTGDALFRSANFENASFNNATFTRNAWFEGANFAGNVLFVCAIFAGVAWFPRASFNRDAWFAGATFAGDAVFFRATFADFSIFENATFTSSVRFDGAIFTGSTSFESAVFTGMALFRGQTFPKDASRSHHQERRVARHPRHHGSRRELPSEPQSRFGSHRLQLGLGS